MPSNTNPQRFITAFVAAAAACAATAQAADPGYYGRIGVGANYAHDARYDIERDPRIVFVVTPHDRQRYNHDLGLNVSAAVGYDFGGLGAEFEYRFFDSNIDNVVQSGGFDPAQGAVSATRRSSDDAFSTHAAMANLRYVLAPDARLSPFLSGGVGVARVSADRPVDFNGGAFVGDNKDSAIAYQARAGVLYALNETVRLGLEYSYFRTGDLQFGVDEFDTPNPDAQRLRFSDGRFSASSVQVTLEKRF